MLCIGLPALSCSRCLCPGCSQHTPSALTADSRDQGPEHFIPVTNPIERVNKEVKRRADDVGAVLFEQNDEWTVARRHMSLETLARVTDNPTGRLPAVAT